MGEDGVELSRQADLVNQSSESGAQARKRTLTRRESAQTQEHIPTKKWAWTRMRRLSCWPASRVLKKAAGTSSRLSGVMAGAEERNRPLIFGTCQLKSLSTTVKVAQSTCALMLEQQTGQQGETQMNKMEFKKFVLERRTRGRMGGWLLAWANREMLDQTRGQKSKALLEEVNVVLEASPAGTAWAAQPPHKEWLFIKQTSGFEMHSVQRCQECAQRRDG